MRHGSDYRAGRRNWLLRVAKQGGIAWMLAAGERAFGGRIPFVRRDGRWARLSGGAAEVARRFGRLIGKVVYRVSTSRLMAMLAALGPGQNEAIARRLVGLI